MHSKHKWIIHSKVQLLILLISGLGTHICTTTQSHLLDHFKNANKANNMLYIW